jgi:hypothetical protein
VWALACASLASGCVHVRDPHVTYDSSVKVDSIPLTVDLEVDTGEMKLSGLGIGAADLPVLRSSFRSALERDLNANGPVRVDPAGAAGLLQVRVKNISRKEELPIWTGLLVTGIGIPLVPLAILVAPTDWATVQVEATARLWDGRGHLLAEQDGTAEDSLSAWLYTGSRGPKLGEATRRLTEKLREGLAAQKLEIVARLAGRKPYLQVASAQVPSAPNKQPGPAWVTALGGKPESRLAVLEFGGGLEPAALTALSDRTRAAALEAVRAGGCAVMTRESMAMILKDMGRKCVDEGDCEVETARNVGADLVVSGQVLKVEGNYLVTLKLHETAKGNLLSTTEARGATESQLLDAVRPAAESLFR